MFNKVPAVLLSFPRRLLSVSRACRLLGRMEPALVRCVPGEPKLTISFSLAGSQKHMLRDQDEPLGKVLSRIACNFTKGKAKKTKRNAEQQPAETSELAVVKLFLDSSEVEHTVVNSEAWRDGAVLQVGDVKYFVTRNAPTFTTAEMPISLLAGFPVCAKLEVEFGDLHDCEFVWFKEKVPNISAQASGDAAAEHIAWTEVGDTRVYVPSNQDIGCRLKLRCTPIDGRRSGQPIELVSTGAVEAGPGMCTFDTRHAYTAKQVDWPSVRVVSYNILADIYAQTELSKTVLYPYCAPYALQLDYRQNLIKKELAGYHADVVCLQEVDKGVFLDSLTPALDAFGLDGVFKVKEKQHEGLATFYRRTKFKLLSRHDITLSVALTSDPIHGELLEKVSANTSLKERIVKRSTSLQVSVLEDLSQAGRKVCVANTHLYWHPQGGNVRLVQMGVALRHLSHVINEVAPGAPLIFCGDFNSSPTSGVLQLVTKTVVPQQHADWSSSGPEESCTMELLSTFPPLLSACGPLAYTNYVGGFQGCLDYIFIQPESMQVEQVIPLPSHEEVTTYTALPSVAHPSDHIALVCDLHWKPCDLLVKHTTGMDIREA
ncbi:2',5'-phosphodiesterase 12 isoform X2 [Dunckerocampus dactyliophorus]|uniref:2',5'-phosphodiesterase 12 isoform X2 n=1 Tax=Dunckerocampus dactyliophorus TaxID=161453 RepID=UPI00240583F1|nr:2',5'-phosphodiesterase 12 isoform X2 [Dunckerocampus dactyliophorus]